MKRTLPFLSILLIPGFVGAANVGTFRDLVLSIVKLLSTGVMPILVAIGIVIFMTNLIQYIRASDNESEHVKFGKYVGWSLLALFVMLGVWGIVGILVRSLFPN